MTSRRGRRPQGSLERLSGKDLAAQSRKGVLSPTRPPSWRMADPGEPVRKAVLTPRPRPATSEPAL